MDELTLAIKGVVKGSLCWECVDVVREYLKMKNPFCPKKIVLHPDCTLEEYPSYVGHDESTFVHTWIDAVFPNTSHEHVLAELVRVIPKSMLSHFDMLIWIASMFTKGYVEFDKLVVWIDKIGGYLDGLPISLDDAYSILLELPKVHEDALLTQFKEKVNSLL